jgi:hypothetical protein
MSKECLMNLIPREDVIITSKTAKQLAVEDALFFLDNYFSITSELLKHPQNKVVVQSLGLLLKDCVTTCVAADEQNTCWQARSDFRRFYMNIMSIVSFAEHLDTWEAELWRLRSATIHNKLLEKRFSELTESYKGTCSSLELVEGGYEILRQYLKECYVNRMANLTQMFYRADPRKRKTRLSGNL